jgi:hypothetical protein
LYFLFFFCGNSKMGNNNDFFKKIKGPIIAGWERDMGMILWPNQISIRICGWSSDRLVDPIKIGSTGSPTQRPKNYGWPVVSQQLGALHQYRAPSQRSF